MNPRIRELFEKHTIPNFGPFNGRPHKNVNGEYHNPVIEDHWQTFQEAAELIVRECLKQIDTIRDGCEADGENEQALGADWAGLAVARYFGVEE